MSEIKQTSGAPDEIDRRQERDAERALGPAKEILDQTGVRFECSHCEGSPANEIAGEVRRKGCEAAIMGTRGLEPVASAMIGSGATRLVHLTDMPVTLIR